MKREILTSMLSVTLLGVPMLVGCDRTVSHKEKTSETTDGTVKHDEKTIKENADGTVTKTETHSTDDR
jgi:hypothetical protein